MKKKMTRDHKHRNFIYVIEKKMNGKWGLEWDFSTFMTYEVAQQSLQDFEKYNKHPKDYRIVMYLSEKPHDM